MKKFNLFGVPVVAVAVVTLLALTPGTSLAVSDVVTVTIGGVTFIDTRDEATEPADDFLGVGGPGIIVDLPGTNQALIAFLEPSFEACSQRPTIPQGCLSDLLLLALFPDPAQHSLFFLSDDNVNNLERALLFTADRFSLVPSFVTETGLPQDVTLLLGFDPSQIRVTVQSDVTPEPSTWILLGSGLAGLAYWRRRKA